MTFKSMRFADVVPGTAFFLSGHLAVKMVDGKVLSTTTGQLLDVEPDRLCNTMQPDAAAIRLTADLKHWEREVERLRAENQRLREEQP